MSVRAWSIKPGELKPLGRDGLLVLAARAAMRVEGHAPASARAAWRDGLALVVGAAVRAPAGQAGAAALARRLRDARASACHRLAVSDAPAGACANHATCALAAAGEAAALADRAAVARAVIEAAKQAASIPAVLGHAGRIRAPRGRDPVEYAAVTTWDAIRADVAAVAVALPAIARARDPCGRSGAPRRCGPPARRRGRERRRGDSNGSRTQAARRSGTTERAAPWSARRGQIGPRRTG
ncbi:MAG: hypothetical protein H6708_27860 [Kofleriaceae bacterium]|nr:hypothetical protein [Kofleriaceae bacterium]